MFACERSRQLLVLERKHAWVTAVKVGFGGLMILPDGQMILQTGVHVAVTHHVAILWLQRDIAQIVRQFDYLYFFS